jgi:tetratricopeptide (TPR) repeat protein
VGKPIYRFDGIELNTALGCLQRDGSERPLRPKSYQLLVYLIENRQRLVTKEELIEHVWANAAVTDDALVQVIVELRRALGDDSRRPHFIKTIPKAGYRFIGAVEAVYTDNAPALSFEEITAIEYEYREEIRDDAISPAREIAAVIAPPAERRWFQSHLARAIIAIVAVALMAGLWIVLQKRLTHQGSAVAELPLPQVPGRRTVAVIFFDNQSESRDLDWLREGLADMLITNLSRSARLTVLGRQQLHLLLERRGYGDATHLHLDDALDIARRIHAETIVMGGFTRLGDRIRVDAALHDAATGQFIAAESFTTDRPEQILTQVDLLSLKLASHLGDDATEGERRAPLGEVMTSNLEAYRCYSLAVERAQAYHTAEALALLEQAVRLDPEFAMAYARIGYTFALVRVNEGARAQAYLERAFQLSHRLTEKDRLYINAWYAAARHDTDSAVRWLKEIIARYPLEVEAYLRLGYFYQSTEAAITTYRQGLLIDPEAKAIYNAMGFSLYAMGRYDEAIAAHQRYVQLAPTEANAHDSLGMTYNEAGRFDDALFEFRRALEINPQFHFARLHLGDVFFRIGRCRDAISAYKGYLEVAPSDWDRAQAYNRLALVYLSKGDVAQATIAARQEIRYRNNFGGLLRVALASGEIPQANRLLSDLLNNTEDKSTSGVPTVLQAKSLELLRGIVALKSGQGDEAIKILRAACEQAPMLWNVDGGELSLAESLLEMGRVEEAVSECERLIARNPTSPLLRFRYAQALERRGDSERARTEYRRFLDAWKSADRDLPEVIAAERALADA